MAVTLVAYRAPKWIHAQESQLAFWAFLKGKGCLVVASDKPFNNWMVGRGISEVTEKERGIKEWTLPHNIQPHWVTNRGQASPMKGGVQREGLSVMKKLETEVGRGKQPHQRCVLVRGVAEGASTMESQTTNAPTNVTWWPGQGYLWGPKCRRVRAWGLWRVHPQWKVEGQGQQTHPPK